MTTTALPQTYTHPTPLTTLAPHLLPHLPQSLPLLRRLQFHTSSPSARTIATFSPSSPTTTTTTPPPSAFAATYTDRTRTPETESWLFSTYETLPAPTPSQQQAAKADIFALLASIARLPATTPILIIGSVNESLLRLIVGGEEAVRGFVPQGVVSRDVRKHDEDEDDDGGIGRGRLMDKKRGKGKGRGIISGISVPYCKWLIAPSSSGAAAAGAGGGGGGGGGSSGEAREEEDGKSSLPPGYTFDKVRRDELKLTMSRTEIPKTEETLAQLGNVAVRYTPASTDTATTTSSTTSTSTATTTSSTTAPTTSTAKTAPAPRTTLTAWAFLSPDGSLTSLHVTPPHRRQGLAKAVSRRLLQRLADDASAMGFRPVAGYDGNNNNNNNNNSREGRRGEEEGWAHSDVAAGNEESAGVARGVGGKEGWVVRWVGVDLRAVVEGGGGDEMKVCEERGRKGGKFGSGESLVVDTSMGGSGRH